MSKAWTASRVAIVIRRDLEGKLEGQAVFNKLTSPYAVKAAIDECRRLGRSEFLHEYGFRSANSYYLTHDGGTYDSKAIAAVAIGYQYGIPALRPDQCTAGKDYGHAAWALNRLGFEVTGIDYKGWRLHEVELAVGAYFDMLVLKAASKSFRKSDFLRALAEKNPQRTLKAFEYKLQNISAVLRDLGRPWLQGYAPMGRYQELLRFVVEDRLGSAGGEGPSGYPPAQKRIAKVDWAERDARNRALGKAGEQFVFDLERAALIAGGRADLAGKVSWLSQEGDGHGYDIASFDQSGNAKHIEVKTTTGDQSIPFFISDNELKTSARLGTSFWLYRVYKFPREAQIARYRGPVADAFNTVPSAYRATLK